ncbi:hypothetical protein GCM10022416_56690 [Actinomadura keratinilytica]|uniref:Uncharacterized protein n=1 Tax=Actinomadura keratinilytica TaxID=547461 RepID=A0ABP7ZF47_9ACTN
MSEATMPATASTLTIPPERGADVESATWFSFPIMSICTLHTMCNAHMVCMMHITPTRGAACAGTGGYRPSPQAGRMKAWTGSRG